MRDFNDSKIVNWVLDNTGWHDFGDVQESTTRALIAYEDDVATEIDALMEKIMEERK
jgi:hypothetical protein